jgi:RP/EB family microtubule-associated protein
MQDNLEFLQWTKRYWDQYYPGGEYDAPARRKASGAPSSSRAGATSANAARRGTTPTTGPKSRVGGGGGGGGANTLALTREIETQKEAITGLEKERDFYFAKLRDIELLLQQAVEADPELDKEEDSLIKHIQAILYSTEVWLFAFPSIFFAIIVLTLFLEQDGFEIPPETEGAEELETF